MVVYIFNSNTLEAQASGSPCDFGQQLKKMQPIPRTSVLFGGIRCLVGAFSPPLYGNPISIILHMYIFKDASPVVGFSMTFKRP